MATFSYLTPRLKQVEQSGIMVDRYEKAFPRAICNQDLILPNYYLIITHQGTARLLYDMQEKTLCPNMIVLTLPGHIIRFLDRSDDLVFSRLVLRPDMFEDMLSLAFTHDVAKFHTHPGYVLTANQMDRVMKVLDLLEGIASHGENEVPHRRQLLLTQLTVGFEFINYYRRALDNEEKEHSKSAVFIRFCDLVVEHFRESREVQYYASILQLHPYYLARVVREASGGISPTEWIEQYIITLAKKKIEAYPNQSLKQTAFELGFPEPTSFYRYFKRITGMTANEYRDIVCRRA